MNAPGRMSFSAAMAAALSTVKETAALGAKRFTELLAGAARFRQEFSLRDAKRRRGHSAKSPEHYGGPGYGSGLDQRPRLGRARGAGSINAKADGLYLARIGKFKEAAEMLDQQFPELAARYRRFASDPTPSLNADYDPQRFVP